MVFNMNNASCQEDSKGIKERLYCLFARFRTPKKIIADQQSGIISLAKETKLKIEMRDIENSYKLNIEEIEIEFVATNSGHQSISEAERLIRSIRENLGNFNVSRINFTNLLLNQILEKIIFKVNKTPFEEKNTRMFITHKY